MGRMGRKKFTPMLSAKLLELGLLSESFPKEVQMENLTPITQVPTLQWPQKERKLMSTEQVNIRFPTDISRFTMTVCASSNKPSKGQLLLEDTPFKKVNGNKRVWCEELSGTNIQANTSFNILNGYANPITVHRLDINGVDILEPTRAIVAQHKEWKHASPKARRNNRSHDWKRVQSGSCAKRTRCPIYNLRSRHLCKAQ